MLDVSWQRPMKSLSPVKIGSLFFSDIVHEDSPPWYLVTDKTRFKKNQTGRPYLDQIGEYRARNLVFHHFLKFSSLVCLGFTYSDSLQESLIVEIKSTKKNFLAQIWAKQAKIGPKIRLFDIFSSLVC